MPSLKPIFIRVTPQHLSAPADFQFGTFHSVPSETEMPQFSFEEADAVKCAKLP